MRTISRHWPSTAPGGDRQAMCGYCGVQWRRSQLVRDRSGILACPDDAKGLDVVSLSEGNAAAAGAPKMGRFVNDGGGYDKDVTGVTPPPFFPNGGKATF